MIDDLSAWLVCFFCTVPTLIVQHCWWQVAAPKSVPVGALNNILQGVSAATRPEEEWISKHIISLDLQQQGRSCAYILEIA